MNFSKITVDGKVYEYNVGRHCTHIRDVGIFDNDHIGERHQDTGKIAVTPRCVESTIRIVFGFHRPQGPAPKLVKKVDPGPRTRGFRKLIDSTIKNVLVNAVNEILLEMEDGRVFAIQTRPSRIQGLDEIYCHELKDQL